MQNKGKFTYYSTGKLWLLTGCGTAWMMLTSETTLCSCDQFQSGYFSCTKLSSVDRRRITTATILSRDSGVGYQSGGRSSTRSVTISITSFVDVTIHLQYSQGARARHWLWIGFGSRCEQQSSRLACTDQHDVLAVNLSPHKCHNAVSSLIHSPL